MMNSSRASPTPALGRARNEECAIGVADVHRNRERERRHGLDVEPAHLEVEPPRVDEPGIALGAGDGHFGPFPDRPGRITGSDDRGYPELAGDDRGMAGAATAIGDDRGGALHDGLPVGIGHVGDEDVAVAHHVHLARVEDQSSGAGADTLADAAALGENIAAPLELEALHDLPGHAALHRFRSSLEDVDPPINSVPRPLDVHRPAVVPLDGHRVACELDDLVIVERESALVCNGYVDHVDSSGRIVVDDHLQRLAAAFATQDGRTPGFEGGLVHVELVRVDFALHHHLPESPRRGDEHDVLEPGLRVDRERHSARTEITADHALDSDRERDVLVANPWWTR